ncbi:dihydroorotate dehydrogenase B (NAD(+)), electron transfer subunit [Spirochaetia bacterium]|nr:dihydroorotate dehydrogenase B (NAD(+)), electron transfer subunit [Spirochaetia bacterium]
MPTPSKQCLSSELLVNVPVNRELFRLDFEWSGPAPRAGQFFMVKSEGSSLFLARPISVALWQLAAKPEDIDPRKHRRRSPEEQKWFTSNTIRFIIARRGKGTAELAEMRVGERAELSGPLGNAWGDFAVEGKRPIALIGGGIGVAPLGAFAVELEECIGDQRSFDFYAGFRTRHKTAEERYGLLVAAVYSAKELIIATEDGSEGKKGRIPDFLDPAQYKAVYACGPEVMLKAVTARCRSAHVPCFISMERRMACGVGACLGCTVKTVHGNRRCCADGPIFNGEEVLFDE